MNKNFAFKAALRETSRKINKIAAMVAAQSGDAHCIEYLQISDRDVWFRSGINSGTNAIIEATVSNCTYGNGVWYGGSNFAMGWGNDNPGYPMFGILVCGKNVYPRNGYNDNGWSHDINTSAKHVYKVDASSNYLYIDGQKIDKVIATNKAFWNREIYLFSFRDYFSSGATENTVCAKPRPSARFYGAKIWKGTELVRDYVPIRIKQTGCLFDLVSGKLFENKGTGNFVLGPDV